MNESTASPAERAELTRAALCAITGLAEAVLAIVRDKHIDSHADAHHAALVMLTQIHEIADDAVYAHEEEKIERESVNRMAAKLGIDAGELAQEAG